MSDEQPTSWRERFFGTAPATTPSEDAPADERGTDPHSAESAPDSSEVASQSVTEHDDHQSLVEHEPSTDTAELGDRESPIEPTVIAPSTLRGPSHSAAHPDDTPTGDATASRRRADAAHGDAADSSLEREPETDAASDAAAPPELVEPRRPSFGLRRRTDADADHGAVHDADGDAARGAGGAGAGAAVAGGAAGAAVGAGAERARAREFVEPEPTQAMDAHRHDPTQAMDAQRDDRTQAIDAPGDETGAQTRVLDAQPDTERQRFGIVRDEVPASSIQVDDETARAAAGGTPIVLVEEPLPPRRKGARGVGFAVALLATLIFAALFAAAFLAVGYLFDRGFDLVETLQTVWLRPSFLLPVAVFFLAYWIVTLIVNRAGWWAHVLGAFIVALLVYAAHIGGAFMEEQGGWTGYTALPGIDPQSLGQLLLAPLSVLAFVIAREVPVWVGGIVARRGRKAREWNRQAMDEYNAENAERLAAYERARG
ncbi:hypothetical protein [Agrococcus carbonis]|uniref:Uncharacterized protein n=1 Tax=Agrococcus carbonis TaxID=684552 RepID=A0A1H1QJW8_9MICO|nr:hypothetical protein [Agrococcus carbonis]SDS23209.1 hypothetical protein SAMN04489719_1846 [Agrococcus carbonis]